MNPESNIPAHLRRFVVQQDYAEYTEEDQAVWRFVVLQTHAHLLNAAHAAYAHGFEASGISVDRIPRINDMSERLERFGWRAVSVDGFIPPRAFQAFQARGILPIASDIRTSEHLTYTPAPDIIHEAAGHAPFLADPHYARYVRRIGEVASKAFASPADRDVYEAIYTLTELKENPASTPAQTARAERALQKATARAGSASESAKVARLFWWTAEYGLVGTPTDYKLYGAGLLSSIGEGHFCRDPGVKKVPLTRACIEVDYDVTRAQPQLFVVPSFAELEEVLEDVASTLAYRVGGDYALETARESGELATLELDSGAEIVGVVSTIHRHGTEASFVELSGPTAVARSGRLLDEMPRLNGYALPLGVLSDGTPLSSLSPEALTRKTDGSGALDLRLASGMAIRGRVRALLPLEGRVTVVLLEGLELIKNERVLFRHSEPYPLVLGASVRTVVAGAPDGFFPETPFSTVTVPKPRTFDGAQRELIGLYERALAKWQSLAGHEVTIEFARMLERLDSAFPDDWLLRWNLLESLVKLGEGGDLTRRLETDLERLEIRFQHREPIATGLSYIRALVTDSPPPKRARAG